MDTIVGPSPPFFRPSRAAEAPITVAEVQDSGVCGLAPALSTGQLTTGFVLVVATVDTGVVGAGVVVATVADLEVAPESATVDCEVGDGEPPLEHATHEDIATPSASRIGALRRRLR